MEEANFTDHFLIAMPGMADPNFAGTLTYICDHGKDGALGLVVNRPIELSVEKLFEQIGLEMHDDTLLGKPVYTDPAVAGVAVSARSVLFGDFSRYFVRQVKDIRFERSDDYAFGNDLITFRCLVRGDGLLVDQTGAVKYFAGGAS